jgi:cyclohexanone monooxygenase
VLTNMVHSIETHVDWIMNLLSYAEKKGAQRVEATNNAEDAWVKHVSDLASQTLYPLAKSWYNGSNIEGKPRVFMAYVAGVPAYRKEIEEVAAENYKGFALS